MKWFRMEVHEKLAESHLVHNSYQQMVYNWLVIARDGLGWSIIVKYDQ